MAAAKEQDTWLETGKDESPPDGRPLRGEQGTEPWRRSELCWGTWQGRLPQQLRLRGIQRFCGQLICDGDCDCVRNGRWHQAS
jgi:hypothetical protein